MSWEIPMFIVDCPWCGRFIRHSPVEVDNSKEMCPSCKSKWDKAVQDVKPFDRRIYDNAPICPHCGERQGFSPGTGDCGCESSPDVGW